MPEQIRWGNDAPPAPSQEVGGVKCVSADSAAPVWRSSVTPESEFKPPVLPKLSGFLLRRAAPDRKEAPVLTRRASHLTSQANARRRKRTPRFPRNAAEVGPFRDGLRIGGGRARQKQSADSRFPSTPLRLWSLAPLLQREAGERLIFKRAAAFEMTPNSALSGAPAARSELLCAVGGSEVGGGRAGAATCGRRPRCLLAPPWRDLSLLLLFLLQV